MDELQDLTLLLWMDWDKSWSGRANWCFSIDLLCWIFTKYTFFFRIYFSLLVGMGLFTNTLKPAYLLNTCFTFASLFFLLCVLVRVPFPSILSKYLLQTSVIAFITIYTNHKTICSLKQRLYIWVSKHRAHVWHQLVFGIHIGIIQAKESASVLCSARRAMSSSVCPKLWMKLKIYGSLIVYRLTRAHETQDCLNGFQGSSLGCSI